MQRLQDNEAFAAELRAGHERAATLRAAGDGAGGLGGGRLAMGRLTPQGRRAEAASNESNGGGRPAAAAGDDGAMSDDDGTPWPDEVMEAAEVARVAEQAGEAPAGRPRRTVAMEDAGAPPLPKLDELIHRIPATVRETLDELFRAKFTAVRRVPEAVLKPARGAESGAAP